MNITYIDPMSDLETQGLSAGAIDPKTLAEHLVRQENLDRGAVARDLVKAILGTGQNDNNDNETVAA